MKLVKNLIYNYAFSKKYSPYVLVEQSRKHTFVCFFGRFCSSCCIIVFVFDVEVIRFWNVTPFIFPKTQKYSISEDRQKDIPRDCLEETQLKIMFNFLINSGTTY